MKSYSPSSTGSDENQTVDASLGGRTCVTHVDHVMEDHSTVRVHAVDELFDGAERSDDERNALLHSHFEVGFEPRVAPMHNVVDAKRRHRAWRKVSRRTPPNAAGKVARSMAHRAQPLRARRWQP